MRFIDLFNMFILYDVSIRIRTNIVFKMLTKTILDITKQTFGIILNTPSKRNVLSLAMLQELHIRLGEAEELIRQSRIRVRNH
jgi:hypothetical protein